MIEDAATPTKLPERLDAALKRLAAALDRLDAASDRRAKADALRANLEDELAVMQDDRSRLAVELDGAIARAKSLELANNEVARRLNGASAEIRGILAEAIGLQEKR
jgi:2-methylisocitrate lyase-like PEP mutase family enzyme